MKLRDLPMYVFCSALLLSTAECSHDPAPSVAEIQQFKCMLKNIYHEARGETVQGMQAVALVTLNRASQSGRSICDVVYAHKQFSWTIGLKQKRKLLVDNYDAVHRVASDAVAGRLHDITSGATHYHTTRVKPYWAKTLDKIGNIGQHIFYRKKPS